SCGVISPPQARNRPYLGQFTSISSPIYFALRCSAAGISLACLAHTVGNRGIFSLLTFLRIVKTVCAFLRRSRLSLAPRPAWHQPRRGAERRPHRQTACI